MMLCPAYDDVIFIAQWHSEVGRIIIYAKRKAKYKGKGERKPLLNLVACISAKLRYRSIGT